MLYTENLTIGGVEYVKTYSDTYYIEKVGTGERYYSAIDNAEWGYTYVETDELLEGEEDVLE